MARSKTVDAAQTVVVGLVVVVEIAAKVVGSVQWKW